MADTASLVVRVRQDGASQTRRDLDSLTRSSSSATKASNALSAAVAGVFTVASARKVIDYADAWLTVTNKLVNHVKVNEQLADVQERVFNIAQQTRSSLEATATLYGRLSAATGEFIKNGETVGDLVSNINRAMQVSGATTAEAEGALVQLSQAFGAGALRGEEFNSVNEAAPRLMKALADSLGVARGALKQMAADGKLTTEVLYKAWGGQSKAAMEIQSEFLKMTATSAAKLSVANNNLTRWIGTNQAAVSIAKSYGDSAIYLSESLDSITDASILLAGVVGGRLAGSLASSGAALVARTSATVSATAAEAEAAAMTLRRAAAERQSALALLSTAKLELQAAQGTNAYAFAKANLTAQSSLAAVAVGNYNKAVVASNAANAAATASTSILAAASRAASGALALVGGPVGAAVLAGSAIAYYYATAETAAEKSAALTEEVDTLAQSFTGLTTAQRGVAVAKISTEMADVREKLISANNALNNWTETAKTDPFANQQVKNYKNQVEILNEELNTLSTKQQALFKSGLPTISKDPEKVQFGDSVGDDKKTAAAAKKLAAQKAEAEAYLEQLRQSNLSEKEMIEVQQRDKAQILADFYTKGLIDVQRYQDGLTEIMTNAVLSRASLETQILDEQSKLRDEQRKDEIAKAKESDRIREKKLDDGIDAQRNMTADLKASLGEQSAIYKASAITTTLINTYQSAQAAFTSLASIPYVGVPLGIAAAAAAVTAGLANVAAIRGAREQGGSMVGGGAYQMAERGKAEVIMPAGASRARTAAQMRDIMGQNGGGTPNVTIVNNTTGRVDNVQTEQRDDGMLMITIEENIINQMLDPDSRMSKARRSTVNQAGF